MIEMIINENQPIKGQTANSEKNKSSFYFALSAPNLVTLPVLTQ